MKKFYVFLAAVLAMLCTVSVDAQRYSLLEEAATPEAGVTYVIKNASSNQYISCKYGGNGGLLEVLDDADVLWQLEATGKQTEAGYDLWYLYSVGAGKYVQEVDLEGHADEGLDGYDVYSYNGFNWELGEKATAMKVVIEKGVPGNDDITGEAWRKNGPSNGFVISRQNIVYWAGSPKFMKFGRQGTNVAWEPWNEDVAWQFWTVKENGMSFADKNVKTICVDNFDTDGDGELSYGEAEAVMDLGQVFNQNKNITNFDELQYFTGLTSIGNEAFYGCTNLTSIIIPNSVTSIGYHAFYGCINLSSVTSNITEPFAFGEDAFGSIPENCILDIPKNTRDAYIAAGWTEEVFKGGVVAPSDIISFADSNVKAICVAHWDTDGDGELSYEEAAAVTYLVGSVFQYNRNINSFNELQYFTRLTIIGESAFDGCTGLTSITIPNSVESISVNAFRGCTGLTSITIPNCVINLGINTKQNYVDGAFFGCTGLISVTIGNSVTNIGNNAFYGCTGLTSVTIPESVTSIGWGAFNGCSGLTRVNITDLAAWCNINFGNEISNPLYYAKHLYLNDEEITDLVIPNTVTSIKKYAFSGCLGLTSITIPNSVTSIGERAFYNCSGLASVSIGSSVTSIGSSAFSDCTGLTSITIPNSVASIGEYAFSGCSGMTKIDISDLAVWCEKGFGQYFSSSYSLYLNGERLTDLIIPNSVTSIGERAFYNCSSLASVSIGNSVTSIGERAFYNCSGLASVSIGSSVTSIGSQAFSGCTNLSRVNIADLEAWCNIPFGPYSDDVDYYRMWYEDMYHGYEHTNPLSYAHHLYLNGEEVTRLIIPETVKKISNGAFPYCTGFTTVTIPNSVESIGDFAFFGCSGLTSVEIPNSVTSIGSRAFDRCDGLTKIDISDLAVWCEKGFGQYFSSNYSLYLNGERLTDLIIPNSVTSIGNYAFYSCTGLTSVTIPNSVTSMGNYAFDRCAGLKSVIILKESPFALNTYVFSSSTYSDAVLVVPDGTIDAYKETTWNTFANIVEMSTESEVCARLTALADEADILLQQVSGTASDELLAAANSMRTLTDDARVKVSAFAAKESDIEALQAAIDAVDELMHNHTVTYMVDGEVYATEQYREGASITPLDEPTKDFCAFSGWSEIPDVMGTEDIVVTGTFRTVYAEGYNLEFLPFALSTAGGADATCEIVFNVGSDVVQGSMVVFDLVLPSEWVANYMIDNVQKNADLGTRFYNLTDPVDNGDGTWHFTLEAKSANYYFGKVPSTKVGSFQVYQDGGGNDGNYAIAEGVYEIKLTNIYVLGSDGKVYNPAPYTGNLYVGSPKAAVEDGTVAFAGDYSAPATLGLLTSALPTDDATITAVDLTEVTALPDNTEITVANGNALVFVQEGIQLANNKNVVAGDVCENLVISDGSAFGAPMAFTAENATYERTTTSRFGTICLPYAVSSDATVKYYTLDRVEGNTLYLAEETEIAAGVPAVFENVGGGSTVDASGTNVAVQGTAVLPSGGDLKLIGTYETLVITDPAELANSYYISKDQFHQATSSLTINPFRAYFTYTGGSASKVFNIATEDDVTAIANLDSENAEPEGIYDVSGAKLPALQKGVNIVRYANGKTQKIIVK